MIFIMTREKVTYMSINRGRDDRDTRQQTDDQIRSNVKYFYSFQCAWFKPSVIILRGNDVKPIKKQNSAC